jgi:uncharacterized membrane protein YsdA (DUF1294 family)
MSAENRTWNWAVALAGLLLLPALAIGRVSLQVNLTVMLVVLAAVSVTTLVLYVLDKRNAKTAGGRVPESWLHLFALVGGWPVAFAAQHLLRHKSSKLRFQIISWTIISAWQIASLEILRGAPLTRGAWAWLRAQLS